MIDLIRDRLTQEDTERGFVLDGFPRTAPQAEALDEKLTQIDRPLGVVFEFQLPEELSAERLLHRSQKEGRADDTPEVIRTRLRLYNEQTAPLVEYYRARGILVPVHAAASVDDVFGQIQQALEQVAVR